MSLIPGGGPAFRPFASSPDFVTLLDLDARILAVSAGGLRAMDMDDMRPMLGRSWIRLWPEEEREAALQALEDAKAGSANRFQGFCPTAAGTPKWWDTIVTPVHDRRGALRGLLAVSRDMTPFRAAESELRVTANENRRQQLLFHTAIDKMKQGLCFFDGQEHLIVSNRHYAELYGLRPEQTRPGTTLREIVDHRYAAGSGPDMPKPEYLEWRDGIAASLRPTDTTVRLANGRIVAIHHEPMPDGGWVATHDDITEITRVKEDLLTRERRYRALVEAGSPIYWRADANRFVLESDGWTAFTGQPAESFRGTGWIAAIHPEDRARILAACDESIRTEKPLLMEYRLWHVSGAYRWVVGRGVPVRGDDGAVTEWVGTVTDHHEKRQAEEALRSAEERLRLAVEATGLGTWYCVPGTGRWTWSDEVETILGLPRAAKPSYDGLLQRLHPDDRTWFEPFCARVIADATGEPFEAEFRVRRADDGVERWVRFTGRVSQDPHNGRTRAAGTLQDISDRKTAESRAVRAHARLLEAMEAMPAGLVFYDADDRLVLCNRRYQEIYAENIDVLVPGMPFEDILRAGLKSGIYAEARGREQDWLRERLARHAEPQNVHEQPLSNGRWLRIEDSRTSDGGVIGVRLDITELKRREEELRARNLQLDAALGNMPHGLAMFDADEKLIICNERYNEIHGTSPETVKPGISFRDFLDHRVALGLSDRERTEAFLRDHRARIAQGQPFTHAREFKDGRTVTMSYRPMAGGGWVVTLEDITERCRAEHRINHLAYHDTLTDLPNRVLFQDRLEQALFRAKRHETKVGLILVDLDGFKDVNDTLGHDAGDALLRLTAARLCSALREVDTVARLGGDEFAVVVPDVASLDDVVAVAKRIQELLREPFEYQDHAHAGRASMGVVLYPDHDATPAELMKDADIALYAAKARGRNQFALFSPELKQAREHRVAVVAQVRGALSQDQIVPYYQPKVCLATGHVIGFEALLRWRHPSKGIVTPGAIAPAFEDPDLAVALGERMLECVLADMRPWRDRDIAFGHVALNLSTAEFAQPGLADRLLSRLGQAGVPARCLQVEVTETVFLGRNAARVEAMLRQLHDAGVTVALDDFGTGFASLTHLKQFPVDCLKIDRSFVGDLEQDEDDAAIVSAVIGLGRSLGMDVTAEGIETEGQVRFLRDQGCSYGQGYLFARPMAADLVPSFLSAWTPNWRMAAAIDAQPRLPLAS